MFDRIEGQIMSVEGHWIIHIPSSRGQKLKLQPGMFMEISPVSELWIPGIFDQDTQGNQCWRSDNTHLVGLCEGMKVRLLLSSVDLLRLQNTR
jgi:hypothetical protein